jgi:hypothetical protein
MKLRKLEEEKNEIVNQINNLLNKQIQIEFEINEISRRGIEPTQKKEFIRHCPNGDCRGFLSTQHKCGVCEIWACAECREVKGDSQNSPHECKKEILETVKTLEKDTKSCPTCSALIFKINGCFAKDTKILMYDGTIKNVQDIKIGDVLIGDDGKKRIVKSLFNGEDNMYEIRQNTGEDYIVNSKHTLVLKFTGDKSINWHENSNRWKVSWFYQEYEKRKTKDFKVQHGISKDKAKQNAINFQSSLIFPEEIEIFSRRVYKT